MKVLGAQHEIVVYALFVDIKILWDSIEIFDFT